MSIPAMRRNIALYPWFKFFQNLTFWQAIWFLFFQNELSAAEAVLLYAIYDVATTALEVPSGYASDRFGRRITLMIGSLAGAVGAGLIAVGGGFAVFALAQVCLGVAASFASGTENALLFESLKGAGREGEIEAQETRGWRFSLTALAVSAVTGGALGMISYPLVFAVGALAMALSAVLAFLFSEPEHDSVGRRGLAAQWALFQGAMARPVLVWLFALSVLMYGFSHVPFVFGQPFIAEALAGAGWQAEAPLVSGTVSAAMMVVSVMASLVALRLRARIGLPAMLMLAFGIQIALIAVLALTNAALAIAVLLLRMVPNSFARPFIVARMQPLLSDAGRATYLSIQSFVGRLLFAGSLLAASAQVSGGDAMAYAEVSRTFGWYALAGALFFTALLVTVRRAQVEAPFG